jgi:hypothetical protein
VSDNIGDRIKTARKRLEKADSINKKKTAKKAIAELTGRKNRIDGIIQNRHGTPVAQQR